MIKLNKSTFIVSLVLNCLFVMLFSLLFFKNWSIGDLKNKITSVFSKQNTVFQSYYLDKVSLFDTLKIDTDDIVFVGDSITDMGEWWEIFDNINIKNRGINGDTIRGVSQRIGSIVKSKPKSIFLMIGTNDLVGNPDTVNLTNEYEQIIKGIKNSSPSTTIYIQSVLPINSMSWKNSPNNALQKRTENNETIKMFNSELEEIAKELDVEYINLFDIFKDSNGDLNMEFSHDGLHLNGKGYMLWKQQIFKFVN